MSEQPEETVRVEAVVAADVGAVWEALRDPRVLREWHGWEYDGLDDEIRQIYLDGGTADEAARTLETGAGRFELEARGTGTVVRVVRAAPAGETWDGVHDSIDEGWLTFAQQLRLLLERHRGERRRTVYVRGVAPADAATDSPLEALGLDAVARLAPGEPYAVATALGDELRGELWYRSATQLGLTVDGWGDGLLVVGERWSGTPRAGGAVLTTFGLGDAALDALRTRWAGWWATAFPSGG